MELIDEIEGYIKECELLSYTIEKSNFMIDAIGDEPELRKHYIDQLKPTIDEYKMNLKALEFLFNEYFDWEKKNKKTRNLRYRRLYNLVTKDLNKPIQRV